MSKTLQLNIDIANLPMNEEDKKLSPIEICARVIGNIMVSYSQQVRGLAKAERKQYYKLSQQLADAIKNNQESIEIDDKDVGFLRLCFRETKLTPNDLLEKVEEIIDALNT